MNGTVESCECAHGVLIDQTYGYADIPAGAIPVQRCDLCARFRSDEAAAVALASRWDSTWGLAGDPGSDTEPGDWWVRVPTEGPFPNESAAVQAWIDGVTLACLVCGGALDRSDLTWLHLTDPDHAHPAEPPIARLNDAEALDRIEAILRRPQWRGADDIPAINELVRATGRPGSLATRPDDEVPY